MREIFSGAVLCHPDQGQLPLGCRDQEPRSFHFRSVQPGGISHGNLSHSNTHSLSLCLPLSHTLSLCQLLSHTLSLNLYFSMSFSLHQDISCGVLIGKVKLSLPKSPIWDQCNHMQYSVCDWFFAQAVFIKLGFSNLATSLLCRLFTSYVRKLLDPFSDVIVLLNDQLPRLSLNTLCGLCQMSAWN